MYIAQLYNISFKKLKAFITVTLFLYSFAVYFFNELLLDAC